VGHAGKHLGAAGGSEAAPVDSWGPLCAQHPGRAVWQIYDHCAALTRLYAVYSIFVEDVVSEYLRVLPQLYETYDQLPPPVLKQHRVGFGQILLRLGDAGPYRHLREGEIIEQLSHGLAGGRPYRLLRDAFFVERQNYRLEFLGRLLSYLGIENVGVRIAKHPAMRAFLQEQRGESTTLKGELSRFVQLRNEAAHSQVEEVIGADDFRLLADFVRIVCEILAEIVSWEVLQRRVTLGQLVVLGAVEHTYQKGSVAIVRMNPLQVAVGDQVVVLRDNRIIKLATVRSIQDNDVDRESVRATDGQELGIGLDTACRAGVVLAKLAADAARPPDQQPPVGGEDATTISEPAVSADEFAEDADDRDSSSGDASGEVVTDQPAPAL